MRVIDQSTCVCNELRITMGYIHSHGCPGKNERSYSKRMITSPIELDRVGNGLKLKKQSTKESNHQSPPSLSGTAHTQRTSAGAVTEWGGVPPPSEEDVEPRLPRSISLRIAPMRARQMRVARHMPADSCSVATLSRNIDTGVVDPLQLVDSRQPPAGVAAQLQIGAVGVGLVPVHIRAVILLRPHQPGGRIGPDVVSCGRISTAGVSPLLRGNSTLMRLAASTCSVVPVAPPKPRRRDWTPADSSRDAPVMGCSLVNLNVT